MSTLKQRTYKQKWLRSRRLKGKAIIGPSWMFGSPGGLKMSAIKKIKALFKRIKAKGVTFWIYHKIVGIRVTKKF